MVRYLFCHGGRDDGEQVQSAKQSHAHIYPQGFVETQQGTMSGPDKRIICEIIIWTAFNRRRR